MRPHHRAEQLLPLGLTTLAALVVFRLTLAPDLTWANYGVDGGELITAVATRGLPHPPGYPLYRLLTAPLAHLPLGGLVAYRFNLFSAVCVALAAGLVAAASRQMPAPDSSPQQQRITAVAVGLAFAFAPLVWGQALITEVYGLALLLLAAFLWALLGQRPSWFTGLLLGLSLTAHLSAGLLLPLALAQTPRANWGRLLAGFALGLLPFAALPWLAHPASPVVWGDPHTLSGWWWLVSGQLYGGYLFSLPPAAWLPRLAAWGPQLLTQFTWAGLPLLLAGLFLLPASHKRAAIASLATAVFITLFAFTYRPDDAILYTLPALLLLSVWLTPALRRLGWAALLLPLILLLIHFNGQNLRADDAVRTRGEALLTAVPTQAILETPGDPTIFALWYFQHVEGQRPDIILVDAALFAHDWYRARLGHLYPALAGLDQPQIELFQALNRAKRPYCHATLVNSSQALYDLTCFEDKQP